MRRSGVRRCEGAFALWLAATVVLGCGRDLPPQVVALQAQHRFLAAHDDPAFAAPDFDDSRWRVGSLPQTWRVRTSRPDVFGWHRFRFKLAPELSARQLALDLGAIAWSDEVFVNGRLVGATGWMDRLPRLGPRSRLYSVPEGLLHDGANVVAIRVRGVPWSVNGLLASEIRIGDELEMERASARAQTRTELVEGLLFGFLGFGWLLVAFLPKRGRPGRATLFLLAAIALALVMLWLLSATFRRSGLSPEVGANTLIGFANFATAFYGGFVAVITRGRLSRGLRSLMAAQLFVGLVFVVWPGAFAVLVVAGTCVVAFGLGAIAWLLRGAWRSRTPGVVPIAVGCAVGALSLVAMLGSRRPFFLGLPLVYYGMASAIAFAILALTRHVHAMNRQAQRATEYSLEAHRRERARLARDLHDGLGQMLALLKLQMQRMGRKHEGEAVQKTFEESAEQVASTLDELRRIARDLRPTPMQDRSFGVAVREYADAMSRRTDLVIDVEGDYADPLSEDAGDELYRITQECLTNCLKHSGARRVVVTMSEVGDQYQLVVADDGRGLPAEGSSGIGLATIRERSELLGGKCSISTTPGSGTRVEVTVPR